MKSFLVLFVVAIAVTSVLAGDGDLLDEHDFEAIMNDETQFKPMYACLMEQGPCDEKQNKIKEIAPKVVASNCGDCTPAQKEKYDKINKLLFEKYPKEYDQLIQKYSNPNQAQEQNQPKTPDSKPE